MVCCQNARSESVGGVGFRLACWISRHIQHQQPCKVVQLLAHPLGEDSHSVRRVRTIPLPETASVWLREYSRMQ